MDDTQAHNIISALTDGCDPTTAQQVEGSVLQHSDVIRALLEQLDAGQSVAQLAQAAERCEHIKAGVEAELGRLHKTNALLIATQFAANHDCEFDASDAIAAIIERVEQTIETLDRLCLEASR